MVQSRAVFQLQAGNFSQSPAMAGPAVPAGERELWSLIPVPVDDAKNPRRLFKEPLYAFATIDAGGGNGGGIGRPG